MNGRQRVIVNVGSIVFLVLAITALVLEVKGHENAAAALGLPIAVLLAIMAFSIRPNGPRGRR